MCCPSGAPSRAGRRWVSEMGLAAHPVSTTALDRVVCADNLTYMSTLPDECCDLIYADPPFSSNRTLGPSKRSTLTFEDRHDGGRRGFLRFLEPRLAQMRRLLSIRGSLYVHLDWRSVHHVKVLLDDLFGEDRFLNEIIWSYRSGGRPAPWFARKHDTILLYVKEVGAHTFNRLRGGAYRTLDLRIAADGRPYKSTRKGPLYFHPQGPALSDVWDLPFLSTVSKERTGYPTQKPETLLERIIQSSTNEGDLVADFFCGSGTTLAVANRLNRRWLGCDVNPHAVAVTRKRLQPLPRRGARSESRPG